MGTNSEVIRILRLLKKTAAVYLLLLCMDRPLRVVEVARLLEIDRVTARGHLRSLASIGLAARPDLLDGYVLTGPGRRLVLGEISAGVERISPPIIITAVKDSNMNEDSLTITTINKPEEIPPVGDQAVWEALEAAGIHRNTRTRLLVRRDYLTPDYVTGHYLGLKAQGKEDHTGLLVTILESGAPAPPLNANRHLSDCDCQECRMLAYRVCPYCGEYPCECDPVEA